MSLTNTESATSDEEVAVVVFSYLWQNPKFKKTMDSFKKEANYLLSQYDLEQEPSNVSLKYIIDQYLQLKINNEKQKEDNTKNEEKITKLEKTVGKLELENTKLKKMNEDLSSQSNQQSMPTSSMQSSSFGLSSIQNSGQPIQSSIHSNRGLVNVGVPQSVENQFVLLMACQPPALPTINFNDTSQSQDLVTHQYLQQQLLQSQQLLGPARTLFPPIYQPNPTQPNSLEENRPFLPCIPPPTAQTLYNPQTLNNFNHKTQNAQKNVKNYVSMESDQEKEKKRRKLESPLISKKTDMKPGFVSFPQSSFFSKGTSSSVSSSPTCSTSPNISYPITGMNFNSNTMLPSTNDENNNNMLNYNNSNLINLINANSNNGMHVVNNNPNMNVAGTSGGKHYTKIVIMPRTLSGATQNDKENNNHNEENNNINLNTSLPCIQANNVATRRQNSTTPSISSKNSNENFVYVAAGSPKKSPSNSVLKDITNTTFVNFNSNNTSKGNSQPVNNLSNPNKRGTIPTPMSQQNQVSSSSSSSSTHNNSYNDLNSNALRKRSRDEADLQCNEFDFMFGPQK